MVSESWQPILQTLTSLFVQIVCCLMFSLVLLILLRSTLYSFRMLKKGFIFVDIKNQLLNETINLLIINFDKCNSDFCRRERDILLVLLIVKYHHHHQQRSISCIIRECLGINCSPPSKYSVRHQHYSQSEEENFIFTNINNFIKVKMSFFDGNDIFMVL